MPYICLATSQIPSGVLQITDLTPNTSQRNSSIDPPGQTGYVRRVENDPVRVSRASSSGINNALSRGLAAYLAARVEPSGTQQASATVTLASVSAEDTVTIAGVVFTAKNGTAVTANQEFNMNSTDINDASSLVSAINHANAQTLITTALGTGAIAAANGGTAVVTLTLSTKGTGANIAAATLESSNGTRLAVSGARLALTVEIPTSAGYKNAADAIIARLDAGQALTLSDINTAISGSTKLGTTELTNANGAASVGTVEEVLGILAGRGFVLEAGEELFTTASTNPVWVGSTLKGSFSQTVLVSGSQWTNGEWRSVTLGGDEVEVEYKPIRYIVDSSALNISIEEGQLSVLSSGRVTLFPDSDLLGFIPSHSQKAANHVAETTPARIITVFDDSGNVLV